MWNEFVDDFEETMHRMLKKKKRASSTAKICRNCVYWKDEGVWGACHAMPPRWNGEDWEFPDSKWSDWCGMFKSRKRKKKTK